MNREQKRRAIKNGEMMHITEVDRLMRQTGYTMLKKAVNDYSAVVALVLRDELKFGHIRSVRILEKIGTMFDDIQKGLLSVEDIKATLQDEINILIK